MKMINITLTLIFVQLFCLSAVINVKAQPLSRGRLLTVNSTGDSLDRDPGDGICADADGACTLRAAISEANATLPFDVIIFSLSDPSIIDLTLGELTINRTVAIVGPGARMLTVRRGLSSGLPDFRIFNLARNGVYTATIRGLTVSNGKSSFGCGIYVDYDTTANLTDITVSNNSGGVGGGIGNAGTVNLTRSLINANVTTHQGGGFINLGFSSVATITDSTITGNSSGRGGGLYNNGKLLLINDTVSHNAATDQGSSIDNSFDLAAVVSILNTIVGSDSSPVNGLSGAFNSLGNNIITDARASSGFTDGILNDQVSNSNQIDPRLGGLGNNGGQTDTRALLDGSPALNRGNNCVRTDVCTLPGNQSIRLVSDQRTNYGRLVGEAVDVGAFEVRASSVTGITGLSGRILGGTRNAGAVIVLTNARSGEKTYALANPFGYYRFPDLQAGDVYVLETRNKRGGAHPPQIIPFDNFLL